jgi:hypothetical protein
MPSPWDFGITAYVWVFFIAAWGGFVGWVNKLRTGRRVPNLWALGCDVMIAGFVGLMTFFVCESYKLDQLITAVAVGVAGHMGSRNLLLLEHIVCRKLGIDSVLTEDVVYEPRHREGESRKGGDKERDRRPRDGGDSVPAGAGVVGRTADGGDGRTSDHFPAEDGGVPGTSPARVGRAAVYARTGERGGV